MEDLKSKVEEIFKYYKNTHTLEDTFGDLCEYYRLSKFDPNYEELQNIKSDIKDELWKEEENPNECIELINRAVEFMKKIKLIKLMEEN